MLLPRSLSHHTPHGTPQHPPVDLRLSLFYPFPPSLSHLLYHQADNAAGLSAWHSTSLPMSRFPHSLCLFAIFLFVSLPPSLTPPPSPSSILVSLITIQQTAAVESAER